MRKGLLSLVFVGMMLVPFIAQAAKVDLGEGRFINFKGYFQFMLEANPAPGSNQWTGDWYNHRTRIMIGGKLHKNINFFLAPIWVNQGKGGNYAVFEALPDAWVEADFGKALKINIGNLKLPFSWHMQQSGATQHSLDFHGFFLARAGVAIGHRDQGILFRGQLVGGLLDYRLGFFDGAGNQSAGMAAPNFFGSPRVVGRLGMNFADALDSYFLPGTMLGKKEIMSFGLSFDIEPWAANADDDLYYAFAFDALIDMPMGDNGLVFQGSFYMFSVNSTQGEGMGFWADLGYRFGKFEPLVGFEMWMPSDDAVASWINVLPGFNYWILGHKANIKFQFGLKSVENADDLDMMALLQFQYVYN